LLKINLILIIAVIIINLQKHNGEIDDCEGVISLSNKLPVLFATNNIFFVKN